MAILRNNVEAFADGAAINTSTSSPDAFTLAEVVSSGTLTARTAAAIGGSRGLEAAGPSNAIARCGWAVDADAFNSVAGSVRLKGRAAPSADQRIVNIFRTGGSTSCPYFIHRTSGNIELWNAAHALVAGWTATAFPTSATDIVELRLWAEKGTTTTDGKIKGAMYVNGSLIEDVDNAACNAGTATFCGVTYGRATASTNTTAWTLDDFAFEASGAGLIEAIGAVSVTTDAPPGALTLTASAPTITSETIVASAGSAAMTYAAPSATVTAGARVVAPSATLDIGAVAPAITAGAVITSTPASLALAITAPTVTATIVATITAPAAELTLAAGSPSVAAGSASTVITPAAMLTLAAAVPTITATRHATLTPPPAALTIIGGTPVITSGSKVTAPPATFTVLAGTPVILGATATTVTAVPAGLTWAAPAPTIIGGAAVLAPPALITITTHAPTLPNTWANITVTATLEPRRWTSTLAARAKTGILSDRRWTGALP